MFVSVALAVMLVPIAARAETDPPWDPVHLALGDSVAFGIGTPNPEHLGYTSVVHRGTFAEDCYNGPPEACPDLNLINLSVPGATTSTLLSGQLPAALALIAERNGDDDPYNDVMLITLTIGGNDLFAPVIGACAGGQTPECVQTIQTVFATAGQNLAKILASLRSAAGTSTEIIIMTYDNPLGSCQLSALEPLADAVLEGAGFPGFNDIIRAAAAASGVRVADTFGQLAPEDWVGGDDCRHPDISGHRKIAEIFLAA